MDRRIMPETYPMTVHLHQCEQNGAAQNKIGIWIRNYCEH